MRTITNNYKDAQVLNLGSEADRGPFLVTQTGVAPDATQIREKFFILRPDGQWADFNAYACQGRPEAMDELVFPTVAKVMETFGRLLGKPRVLHLPVDEEGLKTWIARQEGKNPLQSAREWAVQFKARHRKQYDRLEGQRG